MTFAAPAYLALLALAPLIVYLHMRRHRSQSVPTVALWRLVAEQAEPRPRLRPVRSTLNLWLQLAVVALASLALAEPRFGSGAPAHHVLLIEAGAGAGTTVAPDGTTSYEAAWHDWLAKVGPANGSDLYSVWWVGPWTRPLALELVSTDAVRRALEASSHADAQVDWRSAREALAGQDLRGADVTVVASDVAAAAATLEGLGARQLDMVALPANETDVVLTSVTLELADARRQRWSVEAVAQALGGRAGTGDGVTFRVTFLPDGATTPLPYAERFVALNLGGTARFAEEISFLGPGVVQVSAIRNAAPTAANVASYHLDPSPALPRAVVVTSLGAASPSARVLTATGRFEVEAVAQLPAVTEADLVVVERAPDPFRGAVARSSVLWLGSEPGASATPTTPAGPAEVVRWDLDHPASGGTDWGAASAAKATPVPTIGETLVEGAGGPLVVALTTRTGRELIAGFDPADPAFVESDEFVTFMVDALDWLVPPTSHVWSCTAGQPCRLPWPVVASGFEARLDGAPAWRQPPPAGAVVPSRLDESWRPTRAGLWRVSTGGGEPFTVPVNPALGLMPTVDAEAGEPSSARPRPLSLPWRGLSSALLALAVAVLLVEGVMAGRGPDGYWRRRNLNAPGATGRRQRRTAALHGLALGVALLALASAPLLMPTAGSKVVVIADDPETADWDVAWSSQVPLRDATGAVDLERALAEAAARVDPLLALDVVLASPARATTGDTLRGVAPLLGRDAALHLLGGSPAAAGTDAVAADLQLSDARFVGDDVEITGLVYATTTLPAIVRLLLDEEAVAEWVTELPEGWSRYSTATELPAAGTRTVALEVAAVGDDTPGNDRLLETVEVRQGPRVTVYSPHVGRAQAFANALTSQGFEVDVKLPHTIGARPEAFQGLDAVVLMDVAALDLARSQQEALETWVRDHGGGLALLGGERAFGPGGYLETPLDAVSPLSSKVSRDAPAVSMLFVLDRSGSMQQSVDGRSRLDIAKEATLAANDLLGEGSEIAVVVFDEEARVLLPFTPSADRALITRALAPLAPGGGTALYPGLVLAAEVLATSDAATKHVVVMTDGLSQPGDIEEAVSRLVAHGATVSAIAIGAGADVDRVKSIARVGGGTAHTTTDFRALPSILAQEAMLLAGDPVVRESVTPRRVGGATGLMAGTPSEFPPLEGFVETTAKAAAQVLLEDWEERPLLAAWRYGAGRAVAFASEGAGPWSTAWSGSDGFAGWWSRWLRWTMQPSRQVGADVQVAVVGDDLRVDVLTSDAAGQPLTGLALVATAVTDDGQALDPVRLAEVAPGQYRGFLRAREGTWLVTVADVAGRVDVTGTAPVAFSYAASLGAPSGADPILEGLVGLTGGQLLEHPSELAPNRASVWVTARAWRPWLLAALALWLLFLIQRYAPAWLAPPRARSRRRPPTAAT